MTSLAAGLAGRNQKAVLRRCFAQAARLALVLQLAACGGEGEEGGGPDADGGAGVGASAGTSGASGASGTGGAGASGGVGGSAGVAGASAAGGSSGASGASGAGGTGALAGAGGTSGAAGTGGGNGALSISEIRGGIAPGEAVRLAVVGTGFRDGLTYGFEMAGTRATPTATITSATEVELALSAAATANLAGYAEITVSDGAMTARHPLHVPPSAGWSGPIVENVERFVSAVGFSVTLTGTGIDGASVTPAGGVGARVLASGGFLVPTGTATGPLAVRGAGSNTQTYATAPLHVDVNLAATATPRASSVFTGYPASLAVDGSTAISGWFAATGNCAAATCSDRDVWLELAWASAVRVGTIALRADRRYPSGYDVRRVRLSLFTSADGTGTPLWSAERALPKTLPDADYAVDPPQAGVRSLRITILEDDSTDFSGANGPAISEVLVF